MIELCSVTKMFGSLAALDGISLKIDSGNVLGLVGSNGSGKSTMLRLMSGVFEADDGEILIDGEDSFENMHLYCCFQARSSVYLQACL